MGEIDEFEKWLEQNKPNLERNVSLSITITGLLVVLSLVALMFLPKEYTWIPFVFVGLFVAVFFGYGMYYALLKNRYLYLKEIEENEKD